MIAAEGMASFEELKKNCGNTSGNFVSKPFKYDGNNKQANL